MPLQRGLDGGKNSRRSEIRFEEMLRKSNVCLEVLRRRSKGDNQRDWWLIGVIGPLQMAKIVRVRFLANLKQSDGYPVEKFPRSRLALTLGAHHGYT